MILVLSMLCLTAALLFVSIAVMGFAKGKFNALNAGLLGVGGLVLLDVPKYVYLDSHRLGGIDDELFFTTSFYVIYSTFLIFLFYFLGKAWVDRRRGLKPIQIEPRIARLRLLVLLILPIAFGASFFTFNNDSGYAGLGVGLIRGVCLGIICYGIYYGRWLYIIIGILSLASVTFGIEESSRRSYIAIFIPIILAMTTKLKSKISAIGSKVATVGVLFFAFVFLNAMRSGHDFGAGYDPNSPVNNTIHYITNLTSIDTFHNATFIIDNFPQRWDYFLGETYFSVLVAPIPRSIWPGKPVSLGAPLGLMVRYGVRDFDPDLWQSANMFSLSPSFIGEAYANGGFFFVSGASVILGLLMALYDRLLLRNIFNMQTLKWQIFLSSFVLIHRGDFYVAVNFQLAMFVALVAFDRLFFRRSTVNSIGL